MKRYTFSFLVDYMSAKGIPLTRVEKDDEINKNKPVLFGGKYYDRMRYKLGERCFFGKIGLYFPNMIKLSEYICRNY